MSEITLAKRKRKKKLKKLQKKLKGKGGSPYQEPDFDFFGKDNDGPV